ncbi:MAG: STAS domain-containing protein [Planctomycetaceae bacterium]|nr:STAS domain-containing protein [Planctomycetaceae bacterium]
MRPDYELKDGVLKIWKEMDFDYDVSFDRACSDLVSSPQTKLVIDLSHIHHITSTYIGLMAAAFFMAQAHGKSISIVAQGQVLAALRMAGFANFMKLTDSGRIKLPAATIL